MLSYLLAMLFMILSSMQESWRKILHIGSSIKFHRDTKMLPRKTTMLVTY
ncbi:hypothetical protein SCE1572_36215 [Sorangium cellulosum So0157-2]|uniref:Uncharacterized protein n=1 Tax=Sorangium cellulosum So0157-2 TaxID=1254432 RepID=S4Y4V6_SORCE|nr:hypothetical protein SCE1572_36215 [Sorangium cellulosum So0157-2]